MQVNNFVKRSFFYSLPYDLGVLEFTYEVLAHLSAHQQSRDTDTEAGGQLFAAGIDKHHTRIVEVTGPRAEDSRGRFFYKPDRKAESREINENYAQYRHFVGDWHTHPQHIPHPSSTDLQSFQRLVQKSDHDLRGFVMVIVGRAEFPDGLYVGFHDGKAITELKITD